MRLGLAAALIVMLGASVGLAQVPAAAPAAATPVAATQPQTPPAIAPAAAAQALAVLRDEKRRAELITTLEAISRLPAAQAPGKTPAAAPAPVPAPGAPAAIAVQTPAAALPLAPDSLGAQFLAQAGDALTQSGTQLAAAVHSVNDLPLLGRWMAAQATDPAARSRLLGVFGKLIAVMGLALAAEAVARLVLRRLRATVSRGAHATVVDTPPDIPPDILLDNPRLDDPRTVPGTDIGDETADLTLSGDPAPEPIPLDTLTAAEAGAKARSARQRRLTGVLGALKRLPYLLGRLLLDLVPIALCAATGYVLLGTMLGRPEVAGIAIRTVLQSYLVARVLLAAVQMLVSPVSVRLRLLHISDWAAAFLTRWSRRVLVLALTGYAVSEVALDLGMYRAAADALLKVVSLTVHLCLVAAVLQARQPVAHRIRARRGRRGIGAVLLNRLSDIWHLIAIFYIVALWFVWAVELRDGYARLLNFFLVTIAVLGGSRLLAVMLLGGLDRLLLGPRMAAQHPGLESRIAHWYPLGRFVLMVVVGVLTVLMLLEVWGFAVIGWFRDTGLGGRVTSATLLIGVTVLLAVIVWEAANAGLESQIVKLRTAGHFPQAGRLRTLMPMLRAALMVVIVLIVALTSLSELGINIAPLLAGAGVIGIAVGFGSQKLVQDLITGVFLLLEDAMQVGDVVTLGGLSGTVEALWIRTIRLRALDGSVHIVPFSAVTTVTNQTRDYGYAVLDVSVGLNEEPEPIIAVVKDVAEEMRADRDGAAGRDRGG